MLAKTVRPIKINKVVLNFILLAFYSLIFVGCGKDKTLSDYHQKKVDEAITQMNLVSGVYRGSIKNGDTNSKLGDLEIELIPKTSTVSADDNSTMAAQVYLQGKVILHSETDSQVVLERASYFWGDSLSKSNFSGNLVIELADKTKVTMSITGRISGDHFYGELTPDSKYGIKGVFDLQKNALGSHDSENSEAKDPQLEIQEYFGEYQDPYCDLGEDQLGRDKCLMETSLSIHPKDYSTGEDFFNHFTYERNVFATLTLNRRSQNLFIGSFVYDRTVLNLKNGLLFGKGVYTVKKYSGNITLECKRNPYLNHGVTDSTTPLFYYSCLHVNQSNGRSYRMDLYPKINPSLFEINLGE